MKSLSNVLLMMLALIAMAYVIEEKVDYKLDVEIYEQMAEKYKCTFLTPSASRNDVGMFECGGKIVFKKLEK